MFRQLITSIAILFSTTLLFSQVQLISGLGEENIANVAIGPQQDIYVLGTYNQNLVTSDKEILTNGGKDVFIAKYDDNLKLKWLRGWGGPLDDHAGHLAIASDGHLLATINFSGNWTIGDIELQSTGQQNIATLEILPTGEVLYGSQVPGEGLLSSSALTINSEGEKFYAFQFEGLVQIDGVHFAAPLGQPEIVLLKRDASGNWIWAKSIKGIAMAYPVQLATDPTGGVYLSCTFSDVLELGEDKIVASGNTDFLLAHYSDQGLMNWYDRSRSAGFDIVRDMTTDAEGTVYLTGDFTQQIQVGAFESSSAADKDLFLAKWNAAGKIEWLRTGNGGIGPDISSAVSFTNNRVYITGMYADGITFGQYSLEGADDSELFVGSYASNGIMEKLIRAGGTGLDKGESIHLLPNNKILVAGTFEGITNLGGVPIESSDGRDAFLWKLEQ